MPVCAFRRWLAQHTQAHRSVQCVVGIVSIRYMVCNECDADERDVREGFEDV